MRAKEYIELHKEEIKYLNDIILIVNELLPLRRSKTDTDKYFNEILSADIRRQNYLLQKDMFDNNNSMQQEEPVLVNYPKEIPIEKSNDIRAELFKVISADESFGYMYFLLGTEQNSKLRSEPIDCIPNKYNIEKAISENRDDYPQTSLDEYLDDDFNYQQYNHLTTNGFADNSSKLLDFFNSAYTLYDNLRCHKHKISEIRKICNGLKFDDDRSKYFKISFIIKLIDDFGEGEEQLIRCKSELLKMIAPIKEQFETENAHNGKINLASIKGMRVNFIRVVNVLSELGFFVDSQGNKCSKKDVFAAFGECINKDLASFQNDLSTTKAASNADMKSLTKIFEDMLAKQQQIINE